MTPTKEDEAEIERCAGDEWISTPNATRLYIAGLRAGMERAAKICEEKIERDAEYGGRWGGYGKFMGNKSGPECAAEIRAGITTQK